MNSMPPIRMLVLTLTGRCNFACRYCYASDVDAVDMDEETAVEAVMMAGASGERFLLPFSSHQKTGSCGGRKPFQCADADSDQWLPPDQGHRPISL